MSSSTLIYPEALDSLQAHRSAIRSQLRDTYNRLHSIFEDASFIDEEVSPAFPDFPLIANQRAGAWYVKPRGETAHAYFKSTDGHAGQHGFSLRRANLALLPLIQDMNGIVLVDSTRRGKRFPDALSKTIPLWCAVLNRARMRLLPPSPDNSIATVEEWERDGKLWTLPSAVGRSEHSQMEARIEEWAQSLMASSYDLSVLTALKRPLRPIFVSPLSKLATMSASDIASFYPVVCASASKLATETDGMERARGFTYVQGSGDDHEAWSKGLTAPTFWENSSTILDASREEIDAVIASILDSTPSLSTLILSSATQIRNTQVTLDFATETQTSLSPNTSNILIRATKGPPTSAPVVNEVGSTFVLAPRTGKAGYASFFASLEPALAFGEVTLRSGRSLCICVAVCDPQGEANDLGLALVVVLLVRIFDDAAALTPADATTATVTKDLIRSRLQWVLEAFPMVNPSRAILTRINEYLMSRQPRG